MDVQTKLLLQEGSAVRWNKVMYFCLVEEVEEACINETSKWACYYCWVYHDCKREEKLFFAEKFIDADFFFLQEAATLGKKVMVLDYVVPTPLGTSWGKFLLTCIWWCLSASHSYYFVRYYRFVSLKIRAELL